MQNTRESSAVAQLEPRELWRFFAELATIPRPSKQEQRVRDWVRGIAEKHDWPVRQDAVGNLLVAVPARKGCEAAQTVVLQSHLDMVCEKNSDVQFDFDRDPIRLRLVGDEVRATGTTLGADNGIGVCAMLAAATTDGLRHGPLELLFTIDEETGLTGATAISPDLVRGRRLINLDSEEDDILYIGCAGGRTTHLRREFALSPGAGDETAVALRVAGLRGGHSGADIHEGRGNANQLLARLLATSPVPFRLARLEGGNKHNAIPREARAELLLKPTDRPAFEQHVTRAQADARRLLAGVDDGVTIRVADGSAPGAALSPDDSRRVADLMAALPDGVLGQSLAIVGLVETSNNVAVVTWKAEGRRAAVEIVASSRSSAAPRLAATVEQIAALGRLAGFETQTADGYPGWQPNPKSKLLAVCRKVYEKEFGEGPKVTAIHAGLECGVIGERVGDMDMISFGPTIRNVHSPDESVSVKSVQKFWLYLKAVLAALADDRSA